MLVGGKEVQSPEVSSMTRSGRVYAPQVASPEVEKKKESAPVKQPVSDEEAEQFLKLIKRSEYKVVLQLSKMPAQISMLALLLSSEPHRKALLKVLNEAYVPGSISTENFSVGYILSANHLSFSTLKRYEDTALHITVSAYGYDIGRVLIDNGSAMNICPLVTFKHLGLTEDQIRNNGVVIRAFDGSKHETLGEVDLNVTIGPVDFAIPFQVMDIHSTYNMLLGRPWIHTAGAVPSSLHQRVEFVKDGKIVIVDAKEDHAVYMSAKGSGNGVHNKAPRVPNHQCHIPWRRNFFG